MLVALRAAVTKPTALAGIGSGSLAIALMAAISQIGCLGADAEVGFPDKDAPATDHPSVNHPSTGSADPAVTAPPKSMGPAVEGAGGGSSGAIWPDCSSAPSWTWSTSIHDVWLDDPTTPKPVWLQDLVVTAISEGGCRPNATCQLFVQSAASYEDLDHAARRALRMTVTPGVSHHLVHVQVGDRVDAAAWAFRKTTGGYNELILIVSADYPGCAAVVGATEPQPVEATLDELSSVAYEQELGPVFVKLEDVCGAPASATATFAIWDDDGYSEDQTITSISPYFAANASFDGIALGDTINIAEVTGVFGLFVPTGNAKYEELYIRSMGDIVELADD